MLVQTTSDCHALAMAVRLLAPLINPCGHPPSPHARRVIILLGQSPVAPLGHHRIVLAEPNALTRFPKGWSFKATIVDPFCAPLGPSLPAGRLAPDQTYEAGAFKLPKGLYLPLIFPPVSPLALSLSLSLCRGLRNVFLLGDWGKQAINAAV